ncbi:MAG: thioredoxin family protein, partial [Caldilineaceae bacterium]|nr:thioredoxin family protein [Caldilineaceae bacterium]
RLTEGAPVSGVLRIDRGSGTDSLATGYRFVAGETVSTPGWTGYQVLLALGGAVLGGLLLNLMPCVFPILSIKALALVRAGGDEREAKIEAVGYTLGAVLTLVVLGGVVIALKSAGHEAGWAFQLQDTRIVALLLLLVTAIATNFAGLFELPSFNVNVSQSRGLVPSVGAGALAAFIATPCTGPFMASALGAALLLPVPAALAVFAGLGLGLALPFLALGFIAPLRRHLPRPGPWMLTLRRILSLPMFATALGLAWIIGRQAGVATMTLSLSAAMLLGLALWWYGLRQSHARTGYPAFVPMLAALLFVSVGLPASSSGLEDTPATAEQYSASRLAALRDAHQPVFLYLTADWCMTCKVNEATSLSSPSVAAAFEKAGVTVLEGDWTRGNADITALLAERGRAGVPLYLWYPARGEPKELPQILTPSMLVSLVE